MKLLLLMLVAAATALDVTVADNPLAEFFWSTPPRIIHKWHHYFDIYHNHFEKYRAAASPTKKVVFVEIGVYHGGSLDMWIDYFGAENCTIYGIDIDPRVSVFNTSVINIVIGDQGNRTFLEELIQTMPAPDIILDDGGHHMAQQRTSFDVLFGHVKPGGLYMVEDTHTSYWPGWGGSYGQPHTFIEYSKVFVDELHNYHTLRPPHKYALSLGAMHYYDSIVVFDKTISPRPKPITEHRGVQYLY